MGASASQISVLPSGKNHSFTHQPGCMQTEAQLGLNGPSTVLLMRQAIMRTPFHMH